MLAKKLTATKTAIVILQKLCRIDASLRQFDNKIECGQYDAAAEGIEVNVFGMDTVDTQHPLNCVVLLLVAVMFLAYTF